MAEAARQALASPAAARHSYRPSMGISQVANARPTPVGRAIVMSRDIGDTCALLRAVILCYGVSVKNITVSVPDDVYRSARIKAAERGSSVSAIVAEYLRSLSGGDAEFARREAQQRDIQRQIKRFSAVDRLGRDEIHDRAVR
jgi:hypothetical protein